MIRFYILSLSFLPFTVFAQIPPGSLRRHGQLTAYFGHFTLTARFGQGWRFQEGTGRGITYPVSSLNLSYNLPLRPGHSLYLGLNACNLFQPRFHAATNRTIHPLVQSTQHIFSRSSGNLLLLSAVYRFNHGKNKDEVQQHIKAEF